MIELLLGRTIYLQRTGKTPVLMQPHPEVPAVNDCLLDNFLKIFKRGCRKNSVFSNHGILSEHRLQVREPVHDPSARIVTDSCR